MVKNVYPNNYVILYEDHKGTPRKSEMRGLTADEAIIRFRSQNMTAKCVSARPKKTKTPKISSLFH